MSPEEMKLDMLVAELDYENRLLRARNERLEREAEQRKPWMGLTDEDKEELQDSWVSDQSGEPICYWPNDLIEAIEAKLREKNQ